MFIEGLEARSPQQEHDTPAAVSQPALILADEPTASLDSVTATTVVDLLLARAGEAGAGILLATYDPAVADRTDRIVMLHSGRL